jgi:hypothetical protein
VLTKQSATNYDTIWLAPFNKASADALYLPLTGGTLSGVLNFASANERIRTPVNAAGNLSIESADGNVLLGGAGSVQAVYNGYFDGTNWQRFNTANPYLAWWIGPTTVQLFAAPAGANPVGSMTSVFSVSSAGNGSFQGTLAAIGRITANESLAVNNNILLNPASQILFNNGATITQYSSGTDYRVAISALTVTPGPTSTAALSVNGALTINATVHLTGANSLYLDGPGGILAMGNQDIQYVRSLYGTNNSVYWTSTNGVNRWTTSGGVTLGTDLAVGTTLAVAGIYITMNSGGAQAYSILNNGGGDMYIRSTTGNVRIDSGPVFFSSSLNGVTYLTCSQWLWAPTIYINSSQAAPYLQNAGAPYRSVVPAGGFLSCEMQSGGYHPINASAFNVNSTRKAKDNIAPLSDCLARVLDPRVEPVTFVLKNDSQAQRVGFIAEDMAQVCPEVMGKNIEGEPDSIHYGALVSVLWGAVRALNDRIDAMEAA